MRVNFLTGFLVFASTLLLVSCSTAASRVLVENGNSDYRIVVPAQASPVEMKAALELQSYLEKMSGALLPVVSDAEALSEKEIIIGNNRHLGLIKCKVRPDKLDADGFHLLTRGQHIIIAGGIEKGCLYGVYTLLESYLGCRYYAPDALIIPEKKNIIIPDLDEIREPVFTFRESYFPFVQDSSYMLWHKLDRHNQRNWGMWVHTFDDLVPPDEYFDLHPGYFSLIGQNRVNNGQLCLSNPAVLDLAIDRLKEKIRKNPKASYWSVSQNDNYLACECEHCRELDEKYGGPSGTMIWFVNQVAKEFPDRIISTLAYQYTRSAPKGIRPEKNVNIMLCTIECNRSRPIDDDPSGAAFVKDLKDWSRLTDNILLWDYVVQFRNYISPFPNFHVLQPNLQLFEKYGSRMMFQQGSGNSWSDLAELKSYLIAKLLWDPNLDADAVIQDFIYGYYGNAAPFIRQYFDMIHEALRHSGSNLWIYGYPYDAVTSFLTPALLYEYEQLLEKAEKSVEGDAVLSARVRKMKLPVQFAVLDISLHDYSDDLSYFYRADGVSRVKEAMGQELDDFVEGCLEAGIERLQEHGTGPAEYRENVGNFIQKSLETSLARDKKVTSLTPFSIKYNPQGASALTDGLKGINDYHFNWLGYEGEDMVVVIDLEESVPVNRISADFLQFGYAWIFLPVEVQFYGSEDGIEFSPVGIVRNTIPDSQPGSFIVSFSVNLPGTPWRYLKMEARALKTCPDWHIGAGNNSWIFVDEVVVQ